MRMLFLCSFNYTPVGRRRRERWAKNEKRAKPSPYVVSSKLHYISQRSSFCPCLYSEFCKIDLENTTVYNISKYIKIVLRNQRLFFTFFFKKTVDIKSSVLSFSELASNRQTLISPRNFPYSLKD